MTPDKPKRKGHAAKAKETRMTKQIKHRRREERRRESDRTGRYWLATRKDLPMMMVYLMTDKPVMALRDVMLTPGGRVAPVRGATAITIGFSVETKGKGRYAMCQVSLGAVLMLAALGVQASYTEPPR